MQAEYTVESGHTPYKGYYVTGHLQALVVQSCVVTLKQVGEDIDCYFSFHVVDQKHQEESFHDYEDDDIEFSVEDVVDLGEITSQYLSLSLNPYPRAPQDSTHEGSAVPGSPLSDKPHPFAALKSLKP